MWISSYGTCNVTRYGSSNKSLVGYEISYPLGAMMCGLADGTPSSSTKVFYLHRWDFYRALRQDQ